MPLILAPPGYFTCPRCGARSAADTLRQGTEAHCPSCQERFLLSTFPALERTATAEHAVPAMPGDAECFFHAGRQATVPCERCGRYLCAVCDLPVGTRHLCSACVRSGLAEGDRVPELVRRRTDWGYMAFCLVVFVPIPLLLLFPLILPLSAAAIFLAFYGWNKPGSLVSGRSRVWPSVAIVLALGELGGLFAFFAALVIATRHHG